MKHLPNLLTIANLFCGCIAIAYILNAQPFLASDVSGMPQLSWVVADQQMYLGSIFIVAAAIFDLFDGLTARALKVFSPIGKDLDSLADVVSFGVAPSMILFKFLWNASIGKEHNYDLTILELAPAFLIACFAALRLAKYNITASQQKSYFIGMPVPSVGLFIASFPIIDWFDPFNKGWLDPLHLSDMLQNKWVLYGVIALFCWLMVSNIRFFKLIPAKKGIANMWPQLVLVIATLIAIPVLKFGAWPLAFILYIILSMITTAMGNDEPEEKAT